MSSVPLHAEKSKEMSQSNSPPYKQPVLVTGSSGLIGAAVVRALAPRYQVIGFDRAGAPYPPPEAECVSVDMTKAGSIQRGLERVRYAYGARLASVIHLAAYYDFSGEPSNLYEEVTVRGTERLLQALQDFQVEQFVFSSTMLVHQPTSPGRPISEEAPLHGKWAYPQSKIDTERLICARQGDMPTVRLRIAGVYTETCDSIPIAHQIQRIYEERLTSHVYPGDTSHGQAFVHLDDLIEALRCTVERRQELPADVALLIGEPETYSYEHLQQALGWLIHGEADWVTRQIPKALAKTGAWVQDQIPGLEDPFIKPWMIDLADDHYELDISRARTLLGWQPQHRLIDTLPHMVEALQADPVGWYKQHHMTPPADVERESRHDSAQPSHA
jgi:nucleoside-diphosphate-sugar epimerase